MRFVTLPLCLALAACAGGQIPGEQPPPAAPAAAGAPVVPAVPPAASPSTAAAAGARGSPPPQAAATQKPAAPDSITLMQVRVDCWAKVEKERRLRDIDRRIAFVDKCVSDAMKAQ
jgi:hypothetical protein